MNISEVIKELEKVKEEHGDIEVEVVLDDYFSSVVEVTVATSVTNIKSVGICGE